MTSWARRRKRSTAASTRALLPSGLEWLKGGFSSGTISRMGLIQKIKDDGRVKNRVLVDMLRSGGNARSSVPERLILPRVQDVLQGARRDFTGTRTS